MQGRPHFYTYLLCFSYFVLIIFVGEGGNA